MKRSLVVIDDFHPTPAALRAAVLNQEFKDEVGPDGVTYSGISKHVDPHLFALVAEAMGRPIVPRLSVWRVTYKDEPMTSVVHADDICAQWACLLYINTPQQCLENYSGTAFFRHQKLGIDNMPSVEQIIAGGGDPVKFHAKMTAAWQKYEPWEMAGFVGMRHNRFVAYPTSVFHSRYPHEAFGDSLETGRLVLVCFFDFAVDPPDTGVTG